MTFCLIKPLANEFKRRIKSGEISPANLLKMSPQARHDYFVSFLGEENAKYVNALVERKLIGQNIESGLRAAAREILGMKVPAGKDIFSRINRALEHDKMVQERMDKVASGELQLGPKESVGGKILTFDTIEEFKADLVSKIVGADVSADEATTIGELSKQVQETKTELEKGGDRFKYGAAKVALKNYVRDLKLEAEKPKSLKEAGTNIFKHPLESLSKVAGIAKGLKATLDNSFIGNQARKTIFTDPKQWASNALKSFETIFKTLKGEEAVDAIEADILSRPNAINGRQAKAKLAIGSVEEAFPESLPEKIPLLGRVFKASEAAFKGTAYKLRADIFDKYIEIAKKQGVNVDDKKQLEAIGQLVNSLTGRSGLGRAEGWPGQLANNVFFSIRNLVGDLDILTRPFNYGENSTPFARKKSATNLVKIILGFAAILGIARAIKPDSVELDPRSSDFGKIKIGDTRFNIGGNIAGIITLAARILTQSTKSNGKINKLNEKYGSPTGLSILGDFFVNKFSPAAAVVKDLIEQEDFNGNKPSILGEAGNFLVPLPITNATELLQNPNSANFFLAILADALGLTTNTYAPPKKK